MWNMRGHHAIQHRSNIEKPAGSTSAKENRSDARRLDPHGTSRRGRHRGRLRSPRHACSASSSDGPDTRRRKDLILLDAIAETYRRLHDVAVDRYCHHLIDRQLYLTVVKRLHSRLERLRRRLRSPALHLITGSNPRRLRRLWHTLETADQRLAINAVLGPRQRPPGTPRTRQPRPHGSATSGTAHLNPLPYHPLLANGGTGPPRGSSPCSNGGNARVATDTSSTTGSGRRTDPTLPSDRTVQRILGSWREARLRTGPLPRPEALMRSR